MNVSKIHEFSFADGISSSGRTNFAKSNGKCSELPESFGIIEQSYLSQSDEVDKLHRYGRSSKTFESTISSYRDLHQAMQLSPPFCIVV
ncbi:hypothetical protein Tco_0739883 [Tanacetum coccineum]